MDNLLDDLNVFDSFLGSHCDWTRLAPNLSRRSWSSIRNLLPVILKNTFCENDFELLGRWVILGKTQSKGSSQFYLVFRSAGQKILQNDSPCLVS